MLSTSSPSEAACPVCETPGPLATLCSQRACAKQGVHTIPIADARLAWAEPSSKREPLVGQFVGEFLITRRLGKGGFGKVLLGLQRPLFKLQSAVKLLELTGQDGRVAEKVAQKFETEASVLAVLQHPNIVRLIAYGTYEDEPYLAMEFIPGGRTLQSEINRLMVDHEALEPLAIRRILEQVLIALESAHEQHIIHRDIKPENIMLQRVVGDPWHVKILDFGLAKVIEGRRDTSLVLGTVQYMAPEQIEGHNLGPWTDLYAVGCIAFEFITGHRAFPGRDTQAILRLKLDGSYHPLEQLGANHGLPDIAVHFLEKALARHPERRFRAAAEMRHAWGLVFDEPSASVAFSRDLSQLADSEELSRIKSEVQRLAAERRRLDDERQKLDAERRQLASDRVKLESQRMGTPSEVEYSAHGTTAALPTGTSPAFANTAMVTQAHPWNPALATGPTGTGSRKKSWWLPVGLVAALGVGAAIAMIAKSDSTDSTGATSAMSTKGSVAEIGVTSRPETVEAKEPAGTVEPSATVTPKPAPTPEDAAVAASEDAADGETVEVVPAMWVTITSEPEGADLKVDGAVVGKTPYRLETRLGARHELELSMRGRITTQESLTVAREVDTIAVPLKLARPTVTRPAVTPSSDNDPIIIK